MHAIVESIPAVDALPALRRWTKAEYYRLGEQGFFHGQKVELIEGELMVASPQRAPHGEIVDLVDEVLTLAFGAGFRVRCQLPLDLDATTEPEPDVAVVAGARRQYIDRHPTSALLVVEVADASLAYDRGRKASLYARAEIADYWVVNLVDRLVEVYRDPVSDPDQPFGFRYNSRTDLRAGDSISPLARPEARIPAADLLP